jgi:hypothetical protein
LVTQSIVLESVLDYCFQEVVREPWIVEECDIMRPRSATDTIDGLDCAWSDTRPCSASTAQVKDGETEIRNARRGAGILQSFLGGGRRMKSALVVHPIG